MSDTTAMLICQMTCTDLEQLIATVVRRVVREELQNASYIRSDGIRVRTVAEEATSDYLAELQADYRAIQDGQAELVDEETVLCELCELGVDA